ncbi:MAG: membrane protein insertase YidC [Chthoniobacterales bacterium]
MFDRTTWIALTLSIAGLIGWQWYYTKNCLPAMAAQRVSQETTVQPASATTAAADANYHGEASAKEGDSPKADDSSVPQLEVRRATLDSPKAEYLFTDDAGGIENITLFIHLGEQSHSLQLNKFSPTPIGALEEHPGKPLKGFVMTTDNVSEKASFQRAETNGLIITKLFSLPETTGSPEEYLIGLDLTFNNSSNMPLDVPSYFLSAGGATPVHSSDAPLYTCFDWFSKERMTSIDVNWFSAGSIPLIGIQTRPARNLYEMNSAEIPWTAVASQYFCTILNDQEKTASSVWASRFEAIPAVETANGRPVYGIEGGLHLTPLHLAPGESITRHYSIFAGPKDFFALQKLGNGQQSVMNFGVFHLVSEFLLWAMNLLKGLLGNYAAAIIVLTLLIKSFLWPIQNKATTSMRRMQLLSPRMTELRTKYKENPTKMNEELMKLYKQYGVNPFGGCLPMIVQIPIFFGFYRMLGTAIELRNSHFLWITDLSQPDTIAYFMHYPINLLPIIMAGTMVWQMTLSPKGGDPSQQKMMYIMPIVFLAICYNFASALALYWTTQNIFSIAQLYFTRNQPLPTLEKKVAPSKKTRFKKTKG